MFVERWIPRVMPYTPPPAPMPTSLRPDPATHHGFALLGCALLPIVAACGSPGPSTEALPPAAAAPPAASASTPDATPDATPDPAREVCEAVIRATRPCKDLYLPALLRTRAKYDQPPGIAARYEADGEAKLLPIASEEFDRDFSDEGMTERCDAMMAKPKADRDAIAAREKTCLPHAGDCPAYVDCNMALLEDKWGSPPPPPPAP